jgi:ATP-dependent protease HslVU (ClpYQ) peptidase subunit
MTTVAYKDGVMASDSQASSGKFSWAGVVNQKIYYTGGGLVGVAGTADELPITDEWLDSIKSSKDLKPACETLIQDSFEHYQLLFVFEDDPSYFHIANVFPEKSEDGAHYTCWAGWLETGYGIAIGTGDDFAMPAMAAGSTAEQAVAIASQYDAASGGRIDIAYLPEPEDIDA